jgi:putative glutamine amidotransferase
MPSRPLVGITAAAALPDHPAYVSIRGSYVHAIEQAGGAPVLIPPLESPDALETILSSLHGIVFPGGGDVQPALYGEDAHPLTHVNSALDRLELAAAAWAIAHPLPTLGICRGQQLLNVALGGSLLQDLPSAGLPGHAQPPTERSALTHAVRVQPGSRLAELLGETRFQANSLHHQAIGRLGRGLRAVAWSDDGVVEGVESEQHPWLVAVQFHPEELVDFHAPSQQLLAAFVARCARFLPEVASARP